MTKRGRGRRYNVLHCFSLESPATKSAFVEQNRRGRPRARQEDIFLHFMVMMMTMKLGKMFVRDASCDGERHRRRRRCTRASSSSCHRGDAKR